MSSFRCNRIPVLCCLCLLVGVSFSFVVRNTQHNTQIKSSSSSSSQLFVSIGLGPAETEEEEKEKELVAGVDYEIPNHEEYRLSRRSKLDEQCDSWFQSLLDSPSGVLGPIAEDAVKRIKTLPELKNEEEVEDKNSMEWTPYVNTKLPWTPLTPAFGVEAFGLPVPRRNAETWRHFDVSGMIGIDYRANSLTCTPEQEYSAEQTEALKSQMKAKGGWLNDDQCRARLVYVNGQFVPTLSKTVDNLATNIGSWQDVAANSNIDPTELQSYLGRLTDGFTDELLVPVANAYNEFDTSFAKLSAPNHNVGEADSQFAINTQQGTACFAALNTAKTTNVAFVHAAEPAGEYDEEAPPPLPVIIVNVQTKSGGSPGASGEEQETGVSMHPRTLIVAEEGSRLSVVQSIIDLDDVVDSETRQHTPKLYNGYSQVFVKAGANVTHSYLEESGGLVTGGVEMNADHSKESPDNQNTNTLSPRQVESERPALKDTHLEAVDVHCMGEEANYEGTIMSMGGAGRVRIAFNVALLKERTMATVNGFSLAGGVQRTDMKTCIHHMAPNCVSRQTQKNMIGGRAVGSFRGRIRVEQAAQLTDSEQLSRSILLSDKARVWSVPSLEIIADDVQCTHGATVSDLSEEELFYLRSRGLNRANARNLLMYAFAGDISSAVDPAMRMEVDSNEGLQHRVIQRLENLVPRGDRAIKGEFQSV